MTTAAEIIISRLPKTDTVAPIDIALACGLKSTNAIVNAIQAGKLSAVKIGLRYIVSRESAVAYIAQAAKEASK